MEITTGSRLGPYEIVSRIGAGGMGEVFKARDTRLQRSVAIKVLPRSFADNPQRKARFEREARVISQLNHPHICTLHDVGQENGSSYLVMELLEGESLAERLVRGPLPIEDVLRYGSEIADALDRAHRAGIVHRDLKPGNIAITKSGAKLLDFGLARPAESDPIAPTDATEQQPITSEGMVMGTAPYMAPEQLQGDAIDARTDIFAFGAVLYEMVTGKRAFTASNSASLIAQILERQPPRVSEVQPVTPAALEHVIAKCLAKDPERRWQSAFDIAEELRWIATQSGAPVDEVRKRRRMHWLPWAIAALAIAIAAFAMWRSSRAKQARVTKTIISTELDQTWNMAPVISPDGRYVAYPAQHALWVRDIGELEPRRVPIEGEPQPLLFWSPDSKWLVFASADQLWKFAPGGTAPIVIGRFPRRVRGFHTGAWGADDRIVLSEFKGGLDEVSARGGVPVPLMNDPTLVDFHNLSFLPDGKTMLAVPHRLDNNQAAVEAIVGSKRKLLINFPSAIVRAVTYSPSGYLLVSLTGMNGGIWAVPFDAKALQTTGKPFLLQPDAGYCSASNDGSLVYISNVEYKPRRLVRVDRNGKILAKFGDAIDGAVGLRISPDEKSVALTARDDEGNHNLHIVDLQSGSIRQITSSFWEELTQAWSPDGSSLLVLRSPTNNWKDPRYGIWLIPAHGSGEQKKILTSAGASFAPTGKQIAFLTFSVQEMSNIAVVDVHGGTPVEIVKSPYAKSEVAVSPDGRLLAYTMTSGNGYGTFVTRFPTGQGSWQVGSGPAARIRWSRDGHAIYFVADNRLYSASVRDDNATVSIGEPTLLFDGTKANVTLGVFGSESYDVFRDGTVLTAENLPPTKRQVVLVQNWVEEFR